MADLIYDPRQGDLIAYLYRRPNPKVYLNYYEHCGMYWESEWDSMCDDECPNCHRDISPYESEEL